MARLVVANGIRLCLHNNSAAAIPNKLAADHLARTSHRIALKKIRRNIHATLSVNRAQKRSNFARARALVERRPLGDDM
jgi:hypothetical protein